MGKTKITELSEKAADYVKWADAKFNAEFALFERMDDDHDMWRMEDFQIGKDKGDYQTVTTNKPRVFADKLIDELANATLKFNIPIYKKDKTDRERGSMTEQAVIGMLAMADDLLLNAGQPGHQPQMAWDVVLRGWITLRFWMYEKGGRVVPDLAVWDRRQTCFAQGQWGIYKACHIRYASEEELEDRYNKKFAADSMGQVKVYDYWGRSDTAITQDGNEFKPFVEYVIIGSQIVDTLETKRERCPIFAIPAGATRLIQTDRHIDTIKDVGESCFARNRKLYPKESELMSYELTNVALSTHTPLINIYDSKKDGEPIILPASPYRKGGVINVDIGKGQTLEELFKPQSSNELPRLSAEFDARTTDGSAPPIIYGRMESQMTAQGTAMLIHAGMGVLKTGTNAMSQAYTWLANEIVSQYKEGDFDNAQVQGADGKGKQFSTTVKKELLVTDRRIVVKVNVEVPQDNLQNADIASRLVDKKLSSRQTVMDKWLHIQDVDGELDVINREEAEEENLIKLYILRDAYIKDPSLKGLAWVIDRKIRMLEQQAMQEGLQARAQGQSGQGQPNLRQYNPLANRTGNPNVPATEQTVQDRLNNLGMVRG